LWSLALVARGRAQVFEPTPSGPFCGINCLYTALRIEGVDADVASLMRSRYVGSPSGSTVAELLSAAHDHHAQAMALENLSVSDLAHLPGPAILHVKSAYDAAEYDHFVLCVAAGGRLYLYDPPNEAAATSGHELAALWDGTAIVVSAGRIELGTMRLWAAARVATVLIIILSLAGGARLARRVYNRNALTRRWAGLTLLSQGAVVVSAGVLLALIYHLVGSGGFFAQRQAIVLLNHARFDPAPASIDLDAARKLLSRGALFIDARREGDFAQGHIPGAINLPPSSSRVRIESALPPPGTAGEIVVYCAGPSCPYADHLAKRLRRYGYVHLEEFPGGWSGWQASGREAASTSPDGSAL
jgi:rhodanese-related sulfurtransferase